MLVFIRFLPKSVTIGDLRHFVNNSVRSFWSRHFGRQGTITGILIIKVTNPKTHSIEYHGMVNIQPIKSAQAAIRNLNWTILKGVPVEVREFFHRSPLLDRRKGQSDIEHESFNDLRKRDRRRSHLSLEPVAVSESIKAGDAIPMMT